MPASVFWSVDEGGKYIQMIGWRMDGGLSYHIAYAGEHRAPEHAFSEVVK